MACGYLMRIIFFNLHFKRQEILFFLLYILRWCLDRLPLSAAGLLCPLSNGLNPRPKSLLFDAYPRGARQQLWSVYKHAEVGFIWVAGLRGSGSEVVQCCILSYINIHCLQRIFFSFSGHFIFSVVTMPVRITCSRWYWVNLCLYPYSVYWILFYLYIPVIRQGCSCQYCFALLVLFYWHCFNSINAPFLLSCITSAQI